MIEHGNGEDPADPAYRFPRAVDFGPGACLAVRRDAFGAAAGFDDVYAPAYYEDADLCLALAARGGRTVYVPDARVRHAKKASGGAELALELSERHRAFFAERWGEMLIGRPASLARPTPARVLAARDACADGRILVDGMGADALDELLELRPWARITLLTGDLSTVEHRLARGVEIAAPPDRAAWLAARRFHYDAVISASLSGRALASALADGGLA